MTRPTLYLMFGYPGAGKTTVAKMLEKATHATRLSSDEIRLKLFPNPSFSTEEHNQLYRYLNAQCTKLLKGGRDVIYDANLNRLEHREEKYHIADEVDATVRLVWVKTARELAKERATHKSRSHLIPKHETPDSIFERVADVLETPNDAEKPIIINGSDVTEKDIQSILRT